jgi:RimJ/RimL family protein N-acetyltransferase
MVGVQGLMSADFASLHEVATGSWLGRRHQGQGIGTEMRAAVLHLAFEGLGAHRAHSGYLEGNEASRRVSATFGYEPNGHAFTVIRGEVRKEFHVVLERSTWEALRRDDVEIEGLDECLELFGATLPHDVASLDA